MATATATTPKTKVTVSAPGKILLAGGYLVLEAPNAGFVVAADKRFYCTVQEGTKEETEAGNDGGSDRAPDIRVVSPQFHSQWDYFAERQQITSDSSPTTTPTKSFTLTPSPSNQSTNPFVEKTLRVCLDYLLSKTNNMSMSSVFPLDITIQADNDFYSVLPHLPDDTNESRTPSVVSSLPKFLPCPKDPGTGKAIVHKTGLGSSAALTTSLVGALVYYFLGSDENEKDDKMETTAMDEDDDDEDDDDDDEDISKTTIIHNLAQICHCHAQGKVGSGFDVSSACYGTHVYLRFPKCLLPDLLQQLDAEDELHKAPNDTLLSTLTRLVELDPWKRDMVRPPMNLPPKLQILLADVRGGSESPSMARTVLKWKADAAMKALNDGSSGGKIPFWSSLATLNQRVIDIMNQLMTSDGDADYDVLAKSPASQWSEQIRTLPPTSNQHLLVELHETFCQIRTNLRTMGEAAGVPIEPPPQTKLCDATMALPGVVSTVVPGAGGYDAVVCLYIDTPDIVESIGKLWSNWSDPIICPLAVHASETGIQLEE